MSVNVLCKVVSCVSVDDELWSDEDEVSCNVSCVICVGDVSPCGITSEDISAAGDVSIGAVVLQSVLSGSAPQPPSDTASSPFDLVFIFH